jgi:hypothetical protein
MNFHDVNILGLFPVDCFCCELFFETAFNFFGAMGTFAQLLKEAIRLEDIDRLEILIQHLQVWICLLDERSTLGS